MNAAPERGTAAWAVAIIPRWEAAVAAGLAENEAIALARESLEDDPPPAEPIEAMRTRCESHQTGAYFVFELPCPSNCEDGRYESTCPSCSGTGESSVYPGLVCSACSGGGWASLRCDECGATGWVEVMGDGTPI